MIICHITLYKVSAIQAEGVQYWLRDAEQRVFLSLYFGCASGRTAHPQPVLHILFTRCTFGDSVESQSECILPLI